MKLAAGKYFFTRESEVSGEKIFFFEVSGKKKISQCRAAAPPAVFNVDELVAAGGELGGRR